MLSYIRSNRKVLSVVLWLVIIAFVATIFVVWGVGEKNTSQSYVAKVDGEAISYSDYNNAYQAGQSMKSFIPNYDAVVLNDVIINRLVLNEAKRINLPVTDAEVREYIRNLEYFKKNGIFDYNTYSTLLAQSGIRQSRFEEDVRKDILFNKFRTMVEQSQSVVSEEEIKNEFNFRKSILNLEYASIPFNAFDKEYKPTKEELDAFYNLTKSKYTVPAEIKVKYVTYEKDKFLNNYQVTDDDALNFYNNNKTRYEQKETADASMILIPVAVISDNKTKEDAKKKIDSAYAELKSGKPFAEVAKKYNDNTTANKLGKISKGQVSPEIEKIVFNLKPKTYSNVEKLSNGYAIIYVDSLTPAKSYTFEEKKNEIKAEIKNDAANSAYNNYILEQYKLFMDSGNISAYMAADPKNNLKVTETGFVSEKDVFPITAVASNVSEHANLYRLGKGEVTRIDDGNITYIIEIADRKEAYIPELDKVKEQVTIDYKVDKVTKDATALIEKELKEKNGFDNLVKKYKAKLEKKSFTKDRIELEDIFFSNPNLIEGIKKLKSGETLSKTYLNDKNFYIFKAASIKAPDMKDLEKERTAIKNYIASQKGATAFEGYANELKRKAKIKYNQDFLRSMNIIPIP